MEIRIYEGNAPNVADFTPIDDRRLRVGLSSDAPEAIVHYAVAQQQQSSVARSDLVAVTGYDWPAFVHVSYTWSNAREREVYRSIVSNMSLDRADEIVWDPMCEARQHEFDSDHRASWFAR